MRLRVEADVQNTGASRLYGEIDGNCLIESLSSRERNKRCKCSLEGCNVGSLKACGCSDGRRSKSDAHVYIVLGELFRESANSLPLASEFVAIRWANPSYHQLMSTDPHLGGLAAQDAER